MRFGCVFGLLLCVWSSGVRAEEAPATASNAVYPYVAYVGTETAPVYAGPGQAHYATDELSRGMKVEVLREISGWLAIRPPIGSFCWIPARHAELTDEPDVAMILVDDCPAWIGTRVERDADHLWQVQLNRGDHVRILDVKRRAGANGKPAETWYRIEPPADEMRFIQATDVTTEVVAEAAVETSLDSEPDAAAPRALPSELAEGVKRLLAAEPGDATENDPSDLEESSVLKAQFVPRGSAKERFASRPKATSPPKDSPFTEVGGAYGSRRPEPRVASLDRLPAMQTESLLTASARFEDRLGELELQLSLLATRDVRDWQLEHLHSQAEQLLATGQTTLERGRARLVLDKITQFAALAERYQAVADLPRTAGLTANETRSPGLPGEPDPTTKETRSEGLKIPDGVTYDGVGWLKPVYSAKRIAPPYALVDVDGKVLQYVTPSPGLNLNRYVKKPVGIFGQKSHLPEFKASHLTASKVIELTKYQNDE